MSDLGAGANIEGIFNGAMTGAGIPSGWGMDDEDILVLRQLFAAYAIYRKRNHDRKGVWRGSGVKGQCFHLLSKAERAFASIIGNEDGFNFKEAEDHFFDAINYSAFALLLLGEAIEGNEDAVNGNYPWEG